MAALFLFLSSTKGLTAAAAAAAATTSSWDEQTLMKHPERHPQLTRLQSELYTTLRRYETRGTLLIAPEGINGTICYPYPPPPPTRVVAVEDLEDVEDGNNSAAEEAGGQEVKYDNEEDEEDPVASFIKSHPLFGGPELRTRLSVWKENPTDDDDDNTQQEQSSSNNNNNRPQQAFQRLKIKIKSEIVTLGLGRPIHDHIHHIPTPTPNRHTHNQLANPNITKGQYLNPRQWDMAMKDPNVLVIDTRNSYEIDIGTFESAIDPQTKHFAEFPEYLERLADEYDWEDQQDQDQQEQPQGGDGEEQQQQPKKEKKKSPPKAIAMFCTGGIRCEKATSYAIQSNLFPKNLPIYHLEGGILSYLDDVAKRTSNKVDVQGGVGVGKCEGEGVGGLGEEEEDRSTFHGECFVFDKRVALTEGLEPSKKYISCHGCRGPMERRLLEDIDDDNGTTVMNVDDDEDDDKAGNSTIAKKKKKKKKEYEQLLEGIRNLPPLTYDSTTHKWYIPGLTCPRCHDSTTRESFERFAQRKNQMEICAKEGKSHFQDNGRSK